MSESQCLFIGALSFEERCPAAFIEMSSTTRVNRSIFLDYGNDATFGSVASDLRNANWEHISSLAKSSKIQCNRYRINPYSVYDLETYLKREIAHQPIHIDVTCMTRVHTLAVARFVASLDSPWSISYSNPLSYGPIRTSADGRGWRDTLVLPIGSTPSFKNEGLALGILLAGHEAERTAIAFQEFEPSAGLIIKVIRANRPEIEKVTSSVNQNLFDHLGRVRLGGPKADILERDSPFRHWNIRKFDMSERPNEICASLHQLVEAAKTLESPILVYPFGPKLVVFEVIYYLARTYPQMSWIVCPLAQTHSLEYSDGVQNTIVQESAIWTSVIA